MKILSCLAVLLTLLAPCPPPVHAWLDALSAPEQVTAGQPFSAIVSGSMPDPCWEVLHVSEQTAGNMLTLEITTAFTAPPDVACPTVLQPYTLTRELVLPVPGQWLLRVVEHQGVVNPWPLPGFVREQTILATGSVKADAVRWGSLRARYR